MNQKGEKRTREEPICGEFSNYNGDFLTYGYYLCIFITAQVVFLIIYYVSLPYLRYETKTKEMMISLWFVIAIYLLAYAFTPLLATFGLEHIGLKHIYP